MSTDLKLADNTAQPMRVCKGPCGLEKPLRSFARMGNGDRRRGKCNSCHAKQLNDSRKEKLGAYQQMALRQFSMFMKGQHAEAPHVSELWAKILQKFNGLDGFVDVLHGQFSQAIETHPGGKVAMDFLQLIIKIGVQSTKQLGSFTKADDLDDADVQREMMAMLGKAGVTLEMLAEKEGVFAYSDEGEDEADEELAGQEAGDAAGAVA